MITFAKLPAYKWLPLFLILSLPGIAVKSQQIPTVQGKVVAAGGVPLDGVSVTLKGTSAVTGTNKEGGYALKVPDLKKGVLVFTYVGYLTIEIPINNNAVIDVTMELDSKSLEQVIVVGYGTVKKRDLTGSVVSVSPREMAGMPIANIGQGLAGRVAGVQATQAGGGPGMSPVIRIRGGNSINGSNDPLFVIDGFISGAGAQTINPEDIASVEILKDASATAIYGSRGANGVILITTRRGKTGKPTINLQSYYGVQMLNKKPKLMNGQESLEYYRSFDPNYFDPNINEDNNVDWVDMLTHNASQQSHFISVNGGSQAINYKISLDYFGQDGLIKYNSDYQRVNMRANMDIRVSNRVKTGVNLFFGTFSRNDVGDGGAYSSALKMSPLVDAYNPGGSYNYFLNPRILTQSSGNPIQSLKETQSPSSNRDLNLQGYVAVDIAKWLIFRSDLNTGFTSSVNHSFSPSTINAQTPASSGASQGYQYEWINTLTIHKNWGTDHSLNAMLGTTAQYNTSESLSAGSKYFPSDIYAWYNLSAGAPELITDKSVGSGFSESSILSHLLRLNYTFRDKYLFTITGRADGSSKFGKDNKWGYFPSAAFAWRISEEPFLQKTALFDDLKLRASYGKIGSQAISSYQTLALLSRTTGFIGSSANSPYGVTVNAFYPDRLASPDLKWETTAQTDIGIDATMLDNRLRLNVDYYYKKTTDLLMSKLLPPETGYGETLANTGSIENKGVEISLAGDPIMNQKVNWTTAFNASINRNKVLDLGPNTTRIAQANKDYEETIYLEKGQPLGVMYTYVFDGIWQSTDEIAANPHLPSAKPGDVRIANTNDDGEINSNDKVLTGNPNPKFIVGWNNDLSYGQFELNVFFQGMYGHDVFNYSRYNLYNRLAERLNFWTPGSGVNDQPSANNENVPITNDFIEKGSFLRLRSLTLRYNIAGALLQKAHILSSSIFITAYDLFTLTKYKGYNPEANRSGGSNTMVGIDYNTYPLQKTIIAGINLRF